MLSFIYFNNILLRNVISTWSSGTGAAGIISAFSYAALTEPHFAHWSPKTVLLIMLIVPIFSAFTFEIYLDSIICYRNILASG
jgi:battenin